MNPKLWLNKNNLIFNLRELRKRTSSNFVCPMVKANAYGVGDSLVVSSLLSVDVRDFGVARIFEAEKLRRLFPNEDFNILVFHPLIQSELESYVQNKITAVVSSFEDFKLLSFLDKASLQRLKPLHIKFDLGMSRLGFSLMDWIEVKAAVVKLGLKVGGVCGHFAVAGDFGEPSGNSENLMHELIQTAGKLGVAANNVHVPNSEALLKGQFDIGIRPGISLYGVAEGTSNLKGALSLTAPVVSLRKLSTGDSVSYSGTWTAKEPASVAILPIGYADGLRRGLSNKINFRRKGMSFKQVGKICMDYCMVLWDKEAQQLCVGDELALFGEGLTDLYEWSKLLDTIPYELLTGLGNRVERRVT